MKHDSLPSGPIDELLRHLRQYEQESSKLDFSPEAREALFHSVGNYSEQFLRALPQKKAYEQAGYEDPAEPWENAFGEKPADINELLAFLATHVDAPGLNPASAGHLGYIPGGGIFGAALGDFLAAVTNRYAGVFFASPGAVRMENALIRWAAQLAGYDETAGGNLTSGGSMANLIALSTARSAMKIQGSELERTVIYLSGQAHHSIHKALRIAGMGECILRTVPTDAHFRMNAAALEPLIREDLAAGNRPFLVVASAGTTDAGAIDPLQELGEIAHRHGLWYHVDAAYGGFFLLTEYGRERMRGIGQADSIILDPHKGMFLPYGSGLVLVKKVQHLLEANHYQANYMQDAQDFRSEHSPADLSPELSRHFRGLRLWLPLRLHGLAPFRNCLEEKICLARYFHEKIRQLGFEAGPPPDLSVVLFRCVPPHGDADRFNQQLLARIYADGRIFISSTVIDGKFTLRFAALAFRTHVKETDLLLEMLEQYRRELAE